MRKILPNLLDCIVSNFRSRAALQLEIIVLRHQLEVLQRTRPARVRLTRLDRMFWLFLYRRDRGMDGGKLLKGLYAPELRHRPLSSSERLV